MIARTLVELDLPLDVTPIVYLPGVSRSDLRAIESCPRHLQPLAELQYRGVFWSQANGKDWTVNAFLTSKNGGLGLDVAGDQATQQAMRRALDVLLDTPVKRLRGRRLEAADFDALLTADPVRDMLTWMNAPEATAVQWAGARWEAFLNRCRGDWQFDPEKDGAMIAAERLAAHHPAWQPVWDRYCENWRQWRAIEGVPSPADLFADLSRRPAVSQEREQRLRTELVRLAELAPAVCRHWRYSYG